MAADAVFAGGAVHVDDGLSPRPATHLAIADGRIVAVGGDEVLQLVGPGTRLVDLGGGLLVPGFQDAHIHPVQGGRERLSATWQIWGARRRTSPLSLPTPAADRISRG